ncbi:hypothetical protein ES332_D01G125500v1 [Gossypium tomentosum]|uniref:Uncharacterized protein n=1 Tax=Gossypium tomentosum TaxID=34277 RepID=A0A5D2M8A4_GOSTO|nr:hypothetical protein ES332_D01G125500v1 [Gossypium tomentosum]
MVFSFFSQNTYRSRSAPIRQAYASAANAEETFLCITVFSTNKSPFWSHPTSPVADLKLRLSKAASN